jgi:hypothetical protein
LASLALATRVTVVAVFFQREKIPSGKPTKSYWKWPFLVDLPFKMVIFHCYVNVYQRVGEISKITKIHRVISPA